MRNSRFLRSLLIGLKMKEIIKICEDLKIPVLTQKQFNNATDTLVLAAFGMSIFQPCAVICESLSNYGVFKAPVRQQHPIFFFTKDCPISGLLNYSVFTPSKSDLRGLMEVIMPVLTNKIIYVKDLNWN